MPGILDLLNSDLGKTIISGVSGQTGQDESKTGSVLTMALPVLIQAMKLKTLPHKVQKVFECFKQWQI
ncbi:MAG: hypothetical protein ACI9OE_001089 [Mariniflexile sp.]|jgi:hypothetical protein